MASFLIMKYCCSLYRYFTYVYEIDLLTASEGIIFVYYSWNNYAAKVSTKKLYIQGCKGVSLSNFVSAVLIEYSLS